MKLRKFQHADAVAYAEDPRYLPDPGLDADWIEDPAHVVDNADEVVGFIGIADEVRRRGYSLVKRQG